jgi:hypothetical protein
MIPVLIEAALRALLVAIAVWAGLRLFHVSNVLAQKAAWGLVLACAVAMPLVMQWRPVPDSFTVRLPAKSWMTEKPVQDSPRSLPVAEVVPTSASRGELAVAQPGKLTALPESAPTRGDRFPAPSISASEFASASPARPAEGQVEANPAVRKSTGLEAAKRLAQPGMLAGMLYLAVCAVLLIRLAFGLGMAVKLWLAAEVFVTRPALNPEMGLETGPGFGLRMRFSRAVSSPVTIGSGVLLPADCIEWDAEKLRIVLAHERAHVRQGDFYLQLLGGVYTAVFWFSPLGWWLKRELSDLGEAISDRAGLEEARSRASYAQVLLEFAALPRPTVLGVAMARSRNLSHRIERFLNETSFRHAFAGSRQRMLLAILLVPVALFAGTALIRVEASVTAQSVQPPAAPNQVEPGRPAEPAVPPAPPTPGVSPAPPAAPVYGEIHDAADAREVSITDEQDNTTTDTNTNTNGRHTHTSVGKGYSYSYHSNGESWALVTDASGRVNFNGDWNDGTKGDLDKARKLTSGKFLWFKRDGKSYFIDDLAIMGQVEAMYKPMEELGRQQEILGKKQEELGRQQEALGRKQEEVSIPTPDISKEMARLKEALERLDAKKGGTVSQDELADIEGKIGDVQGRLGEIQGRIGEKQGELGGLQGKLGEEQGKLGEQEGKLGEEQGRLAGEADRKVKSIIDESLHNGKARPVE